MIEFDDTFPLSDPLKVDGNYIPAYQVIKTLASTLTPLRRQKIAKVVKERNFNVTIILEELSDPGNMAAIMRSAEAFGFSSIHIIPNLNKKNTEKKKRFTNRVSQGAEKWLLIHEWSQIELCIEKLRSKGFLIAGTSFSTNSISISEMNFDNPIAIAFGNEFNGISPILLDSSDFLFNIPMFGFTRSFNVSVAAAITMSEIRNQLSYSSPNINSKQKRILTAHYYIKSNPRAGKILKNKTQFDKL